MKKLEPLTEEQRRAMTKARGWWSVERLLPSGWTPLSLDADEAKVRDYYARCVATGNEVRLLNPDSEVVAHSPGADKKGR